LRTFTTDTKDTKGTKAQETKDTKGTKAQETNQPGGDSNVAISTDAPQSNQVSPRHSSSRVARSYDPFFDDWKDFSRRMDKYLTTSFGLPSTIIDPFSDWTLSPRQFATMSEFQPSVDISESEKAYHVHAELPGIPKENIHVSIRDGMLEIRGNKQYKKETKDEKRNYSRVERSYGSFVRRIAVPKEVDVSKVKAKFDNGVLELEVPKPEPAQQEQFQVKIE